MPIVPLPQFEADLAELDREAYERLKPPTSIVVRFGVMKMVGEFPYSGDAKPGCGSKLVVRTHRGTELGEMLTSTCPNAGCSKSVTRREMLEYIENSGGKDYPFFTQGKVVRIATTEDLNAQRLLDEQRPELILSTRALIASLGMKLKLVDVEPILGQERLTFYFASEERLDFRNLVSELAKVHTTRIDMRQVGARDEARISADYERCGQHCCCKQFLKVLRPVSMKSAKVQKATLDPLKISGRCGRLMCCLRYEDQTYDELKKRLPKKKTRVLTEHGYGLVLDSQILTQLVLVQLEDTPEQIAVAVEDLLEGGPDGPKTIEDVRARAAGKAGPKGPGGAGLPEFDHTDDDDAPSAGAPREAAPPAPPRSAGPARPMPQGRPASGPRPPRPAQPGRPGSGPGGGPASPTNQGPREGDRGRPAGPGGPPREQGQRGPGGPSNRPGADRPRPERPASPDRPERSGPPSVRPPAQPPAPLSDEELDQFGEIDDGLDDGPRSGGGPGPSGSDASGDESKGRRRRRRRRRGPGGGGGGPGGSNSAGGGGGGPGAGGGA